MPPVKASVVVDEESDEMPLAFVVEVNARNETVWLLLAWSL